MEFAPWQIVRLLQMASIGRCARDYRHNPENRKTAYYEEASYLESLLSMQMTDAYNILDKRNSALIKLKMRTRKGRE